MTTLIAVLALFGHFAACIALINRVHALGLPRPALRMCDLIWCSFAAGVPSAIVGLYWTSSEVSWNSHWLSLLASLYVAFAVVAAFVALWFRCTFAFKLGNPTDRLVSNHTEYISIEKALGHRPTGDLATRCLAAIPGNQIMNLSIHRKTVCLPRLDPELDGLTITHLTDLHFTGQIKREFFAEVVRQANKLDSDMVVITGDIIDKARCLEWIPDVLGKLESRLGVYFVLGNHDKRLKNDALVRDKLTDAGLIDLGGTVKIIEHASRPILLAGNELPWYRPAADLPSATTLHNGHRPLRILLTHTPDQLRWARERDVDLMLAGHTHGGQVRLPLIGPILSPSLFGVRHASGTFVHHPTLLHVSRGISGTRPLRFNCPPELPQLKLKARESCGFEGT